MWRVGGLSPSSTVGQLKQQIFSEHGVPLKEQRIHLDRGCKDTPCPVKKTLKQLGLRHGSMVYIKFDSAKVNVMEKSTKRVISEDGTLVAVSDDRGVARVVAVVAFRAGESDCLYFTYLYLSEHFKIKHNNGEEKNSKLTHAAPRPRPLLPILRYELCAPTASKQATSSITDRNAVRPGLMSLRSRKVGYSNGLDVARSECVVMRKHSSLRSFFRQ